MLLDHIHSPQSRGTLEKQVSPAWFCKQQAQGKRGGFCLLGGSNDEPRQSPQLRSDPQPHHQTSALQPEKDVTQLGYTPHTHNKPYSTRRQNLAPLLTKCKCWIKDSILQTLPAKHSQGCPPPAAERGSDAVSWLQVLHTQSSYNLSMI